MQVTKEPIDPCQVELTIEVEGDRVARAIDQAYRDYAKHIHIRGFRPGKAPMSFVKQRVAESDVRQRAAEILVEPAYAEAIKAENIEPYGSPQLELVQLDLTDKPFIFKAVVPLMPEVQLGQYIGLEVTRKRYVVRDTDVDAQIERLRSRAASYPTVERPVEMGDLVVADLAAVTEARPEASDGRRTMIEIGVDNIPGFDDQLMGMAVGEEKTFSLTYPDDYREADLAGSDVEFSVYIHEVRAKTLPDIDDAFVAQISKGSLTTVAELRADIRADMERSLYESADREVDGAIVEKIISDSKISFPPTLLDAEVDIDVKDLVSRLEKEGVDIEDYLTRIEKSREELMDELRQEADRRLRIGLVLGEIAAKENLRIEQSDIDNAVAERAKREGASPSAMLAFLEKSDGMPGLRNRAQTKKVLDFLRAATIMKEEVVNSIISPDDASADGNAAPAHDEAQAAAEDKG